MAMNNSNYGYPPTGYSSPYSSTPSGIRTQRPRFGYSGPSLYPRPRSSASKPNPDSYSDSMINNYGNSNSQIDLSYNSENGNSYNDSYHGSGSSYYSANESYYNQSNEESYVRKEPAVMRDSSMMYGGERSRGDNLNTGILPKPTSQYGPSKYPFNNSSYGMVNLGEYQGNIQKNRSSAFGFGDNNNKNPFNRRFGKAKRRMATSKQSVWKCELCGLDFTSQIPYDMHLGGARHAKKLKAKEALNAVQSQATNSTVQGPDGEKAFFCELCNVKANSLLQLQTHLDGNKHKNKLQPKESKDQSEESKEKETTSVNGKTNGSLTRSLPADFGEPQPTKLTKFACEVCGITVNSEIQLQQHMSSKKHQNKVEGKPVVKGKKAKLEKKTASEPDADMEAEQTTTETSDTETSKMVVGVKTLASSFVQGGTLQ